MCSTLCVILLLFPFFSCGSIIWPRHIYWSHSSQNRSILGSPRLFVFASLLHYIVVSEMYYTRCIFFHVIYNIIIFLRRRIWSPLAFKGDPKVCSPSSVWQISRVSPVLLPKTNRIVLCQRRGGRYEI